MSNKQAIIDKILKNEKAINERWNVGDKKGEKLLSNWNFTEGNWFRLL